MEQYLVWFAMIVGFAGWLWGAIAGRRTALAAGADSLPFRILSVLLPPLALLVMLPGSGVFTPGAGVGVGLFLGGVAALLTVCTLPDTEEALAPAVAVRTAVTAAGLPLVTVGIALLFLRGSIIDSLMGVAIGWFCIAFIEIVGTLTSAPGRIALAASAAFAITLSATAALGIYRDPLDPAIARGTWSAVALTLGAAVPLALMGAAIPALRRRIAGLPAGIWIGFALLDLLAWLLGGRVVGEIRLVPVIAVGLILGPLSLAILRDAGATRARGVRALNAPLLLGLPPIAVLMVAAGFMVAFQLLQGFGVGLLTIALWATGGALIAAPPPAEVTAAGDVLPDESEIDAHHYFALLAVGVVLVLYRVFATRFASDLRGVTLTDHYALFGLIAGAMLPATLAALLPRERGGLGYLILTGALALAAPAVIVILWGPKCAVALIFGLALGAAMAFGAHPEETPRDSLRPGLLAVGMALALTQWMGRLLPVADMTRDERVRVLLAVGAALLVLVGIVEYVRRRTPVPATDRREATR